MRLLNYICLSIIICIGWSVFRIGIFPSKSENTAGEKQPGILQSLSADGEEDSIPTSKIITKSGFETKPAGNQSQINKRKPSVQNNLFTQKHSISPVGGISSQQANSLDSILTFLSDPNDDEAEKVQAAKKWRKPHNREEILLLIQLTKDAEELRQSELKDQLLQTLAGTDSNGVIEVLVSFMKGEESVSGITFAELQEDFQYAIEKAIRLNPDDEWTGQVLAAESGYRSSEENVENLQNIHHPVMFYHLAREADQRGEVEKVAEIVDSLVTIDDSGSLKAIIRLGKDSIISVDDASLAAFDWAASHQDSVKQDRYESYLSEPNADSVERTIAAYTLAGSRDADKALSSLQKAYENETDENVRPYYEQAIRTLTQRVETPRD